MIKNKALLAIVTLVAGIALVGLSGCGKKAEHHESKKSHERGAKVCKKCGMSPCQCEKKCPMCGMKMKHCRCGK